ncbi:hypothetical protein AVEN_226748-1 [Araneus ventricosus]|uniref:Uncharacterized protein n=1 Tax=Araneus ventricosus TaxID=182803 RepID=A0A4Y2GH03_ARAVE|nr:hypothetical protein AVEN_226748-1 [Araneus ventricosus]
MNRQPNFLQQSRRPSETQRPRKYHQIITCFLQISLAIFLPSWLRPGDPDDPSSPTDSTGNQISPPTEPLSSPSPDYWFPHHGFFFCHSFVCSIL